MISLVDECKGAAKALVAVGVIYGGYSIAKYYQHQSTKKNAKTKDTSCGKASDYDKHAGFVSELGEDVIFNLLKPKENERYLDLGCGTGTLMEKLSTKFNIKKCDMVGVDHAPDMIESAKKLGLTAHVMDGHELTFVDEFDAVFSNAALHWMKDDPMKVIAGVARALKPRGRFCGEFGGFTNVAAITVAFNAALELQGIASNGETPWFFPCAEEYKEMLQSKGFEVTFIALIPRPTPLTDIRHWLRMFGKSWLAKVEGAAAQERLVEDAARLLRPALYSPKLDMWSADYVRLRFSCTKKA